MEGEGIAMNISYWTCSEEGYHFHWEGDSPQWEDIHTELDMLEMEGKAVKVGDSYRISHETAVSFSRDERELLTLPPIFPYPLFVGKEGLPQNNSFRLKVNFQKADGTYFMNPEVIGSYIDIRPGCCYMCSEAQYAILKSASSCNAEIGRLKEREKILACSLRYVALIKENAKKIDARLDPFLEKIDVVAPDYLSISVKEDTDGTYYASPIILNADGSPYGEKDASEFGRKFKNGSKAQRSYMGKDRTYYVFDQEQQDGLQQIKEARKLTKEQAKTLVMSPQSVFTGAPFRFDRGEYSDRVIEYGAFIAKKYPYLNGIEGGWLPEEGSVGREDLDGIDELDEPEVTEENVAILKELIENAFAKNKSSISYQGKTYKLTGAFIEKVMGKDDVTDSTGGSADGEKPKEDRGNLISEENAESVGYEQANEQRRQKRREARFQKLGADLSMEQVLSGFKDDVVPFSYQKEGIRWMAQNWKAGYQGVLLADDMGLGKTLQAIAMLANVYPQEPRSSLIVMPRTLLFNWGNEIRKFRPELTFYTYHGTSRDLQEAKQAQIILTTYATVRNDIETLKDEEFYYVILDESQNIKNMQSQVSRAAMLLKAQHRLALSGTPIENNLGELYTLFRFLNPAMFGSTEDFTRQYATPIQKDGDKEALHELKKKIYPFILRRVKAEVLTELPEKIEQILYVDMSPEQQAFYEQRRLFYYKTVKEQIKEQGVRKSQFFSLQALSELRQIASIPDAKSDNAIASPKRELLQEQIMDVIASGHKVLVFANFLASLEGVAEDLAQAEIQYLLMTGATRDRQTLVQQFQNDDNVKVFLMTLKTGGVGLNLTAADYIFIYDPWWNIAAENQAIDRTHRIGQDKTVFSYKLITKGTIEEKILKLQELKRELFDNLISSDGASIKALDEEDVEFVLGM